MSCGNNNCTSNQGKSGNQENLRRDFLADGLMGGIGDAFLSGCSNDKDARTENGEKVNVLTHGGKLVTVDKSQVADFKPPYLKKKFAKVKN